MEVRRLVGCLIPTAFKVAAVHLVDRNALGADSLKLFTEQVFSAARESDRYELVYGRRPCFQGAQLLTAEAVEGELPSRTRFHA